MFYSRVELDWLGESIRVREAKKSFHLYTRGPEVGRTRADEFQSSRDGANSRATFTGSDPHPCSCLQTGKLILTINSLSA